MRSSASVWRPRRSPARRSSWSSACSSVPRPSTSSTGRGTGRRSRLLLEVDACGRAVHRLAGDQRRELASEEPAPGPAPADRDAAHDAPRVGLRAAPVPGHRRLGSGVGRDLPRADGRRARPGGRDEPEGAGVDPPGAEHREWAERRPRAPVLRPRARGGGRDHGRGCPRHRRGVPAITRPRRHCRGGGRMAGRSRPPLRVGSAAGSGGSGARSPRSPSWSSRS